jgi:phage gp36-like protein
VTAVSDRLDAIQKRAEGLTDLCAEHLRQSIRHVQRNCDIDCNVHEDEAEWDACKQPDRYDGDRMAAALADVPFLLDLAGKQQAQLEAVRDLADQWHARGESDMAFSKTIPDENISIVILTDGATMVEIARHIRNALEGSA